MELSDHGHHFPARKNNQKLPASADHQTDLLLFRPSLTGLFMYFPSLDVDGEHDPKQRPNPKRIQLVVRQRFLGQYEKVLQ
jgi:hypothetical protein